MTLVLLALIGGQTKVVLQAVQSRRAGFGSFTYNHADRPFLYALMLGAEIALLIGAVVYLFGVMIGTWQAFNQ